MSIWGIWRSFPDKVFPDIDFTDDEAVVQYWTTGNT